MKLRPHHLIDIVCSYGHGEAFEPHPYGHAVHTVAVRVMEDPDVEIEFVVAADDICAPCRHLRADGQCDDILSQLAKPVSKQSYNDRLDRKVLAYLEMEPGVRMTVSAFVVKIGAHMPGIAEVCTHPGEEPEYRMEGLRRGLAMFAHEGEGDACPR